MPRRPADIGRLHILLPLRSLATGKARLGGAIDAEERETLLRGMLRQTLATLRSWPAAHAIHLVSTDPGVLAEGIAVAADRPTGPPVRTLLQEGEGLNAALALARDDALAEGATATLTLPADLPLLDVEALDRLLEAADAALAAGSGRPIVVVAPSDARNGTNALLLSPPDLIEPDFGLSSLEAHLRAAKRVDASLQIVEDARLGFDLDTPEDLERLEEPVVQALTAAGAERVEVAAE